MKARISLTRKNETRVINLRDSNLLITFHNRFEAEQAYARLKKEMEKEGWGPTPAENSDINQTYFRHRYMKILGRKLRLTE